MRVPIRVQQSGGEPIHTASACGGPSTGARPPPTSISRQAPQRQDRSSSASLRALRLDPVVPARSWGSYEEMVPRLNSTPTTEPPSGIRSPGLDRPFHYSFSRVIRVISSSVPGGRAQGLGARRLLGGRPSAYRATTNPTIGRFSLIDAAEPKNLASPKLKMPPSVATSQ